ncbi:hypothetical protein BJ912DRAFT_73602 [Pholiota molesta]|nr:hypothetical protein BJ912DRAFT_73602 [Pholiota molesta]
MCVILIHVPTGLKYLCRISNAQRALHKGDDSPQHTPEPYAAQGRPFDFQYDCLHIPSSICTAQFSGAISLRFCLFFTGLTALAVVVVLYFLSYCNIHVTPQSHVHLIPPSSITRPFQFYHYSPAWFLVLGFTGVSSHLIINLISNYISLVFKVVISKVSVLRL